MKLNFYEPTVLKFHPTISGTISTAQATMPGMLEHSIIYFWSTCLIQENYFLKTVSTVWGLNPQPLSHESSALTARRRLLAKLSISLGLSIGLYLRTWSWSRLLISIVSKSRSQQSRKSQQFYKTWSRHVKKSWSCSRLVLTVESPKPSCQA
jgi:hypothetical protein